jgi:uncharacterized membrane protein YphA (DoxX/SURF4 family)
MRNLLLSLANVCRVLVGALFVISGLIKINDALGFMYKLEEYFEPGALNLEAWAPYALELGMLASIGEVLLGVALLVGALPRLTTALTLVLMIFFTWLTWYTDHCDPFGSKMVVQDGIEVEIPNQCVLSCGCFGNAIPLTPHESFIKDLVLLVLLLPVLWGAWTGGYGLNEQKRSLWMYTSALLVTWLFAETMLEWSFPTLFLALGLAAAEVVRRRWKGQGQEWAMAAGVLVVALGFQFYTLRHLPVKDYRPYAVGEDINRNMASADELGLDPPVFDKEVRFYHPDTGADTTVLQSAYMAGKLWQDEAFKAVYPEADWDGAREFKVSEGYEPLIFDLDATDPGGNSQLSDLLGEGYTLLHISKDLAASEAQGQAEINALFADAKNRGWRTAALTPSTPEGAVAFAAEHGADYPFYTTDPTELKIIVRNNPGVVLIQDGVVLDKWAWRDIPRSCDAALGRD